MYTILSALLWHTIAWIHTLIWWCCCCCCCSGNIKSLAQRTSTNMYNGPSYERKGNSNRNSTHLGATLFIVDKEREKEFRIKRNEMNWNQKKKYHALKYRKFRPLWRLEDMYNSLVWHRNPIDFKAHPNRSDFEWMQSICPDMHRFWIWGVYVSVCHYPSDTQAHYLFNDFFFFNASLFFFSSFISICFS